MPYIAQKDRENLDDVAENYGGEFAQNGGELNYLISSLISDYIMRKGLRYQNISDVLGALEGAKFEFLRRIVDPYEDQKISENGDLPSYQYVTEKMRFSR
jgi:hypothetical protein